MAKRKAKPRRPALPRVDFTALDAAILAGMAEAGAEVAECMRVLAKTGDNVVSEMLRGAGTFYEWNHYPDGDVYDHESHSQYYYHAHPQEMRPGEHGHFHTFLRPRGMAEGVTPAPLPDFVAPEGDNDALSHLIGVSMNAYGVPIRLFTTNRWVTGEFWYAADDVCAMVERYVIDQASPSWPTNRWITAMLRLFRPQIVLLLEARDAMVARWQAAYPDRNAYEDRALEITSTMDISVDDQIAAIAAARGLKG